MGKCFHQGEMQLVEFTPTHDVGSELDHQMRLVALSIRSRIIFP